MNNIKMFHFDRTDASEWIDVNKKVHQKCMIFVTISVF